MLALSRHRGIGGEIKRSPEDFVVKEITGGGVKLEPGRRYDAASAGEKETAGGKHVSFVLQKRDWNTVSALISVAKRLGHGRKSIGYAGTKDKCSVSVQLASIYHPGECDMSGIRIKDISINGSWRSNGVELGSDLGNAFEVAVRGATNAGSVGEIFSELDGRMPNYFGSQRFGDRLNNAKVGLHMLKGDFESAAIVFLTDTQNERNEAAKEARERLRDTMDFEFALGYFPKYLKGERTMLAYLARYKGNYANAFRLLPRGLLMLFIHAVQALVFNAELEERIRNGNFDSGIYAGTDFYGFPDIGQVGAKGDFPLACILGYETKEDEVDEYAKGVIESLGIRKEDFRIKGIPELSMKGSYRPIIVPVKEFTCRTEGSDVKLCFSLPKGSYATVLLNEFMKSNTAASGGPSGESGA